MSPSLQCQVLTMQPIQRIVFCLVAVVAMVVSSTAVDAKSPRYDLPDVQGDRYEKLSKEEQTEIAIEADAVTIANKFDLDIETVRSQLSYQRLAREALIELDQLINFDHSKYTMAEFDFESYPPSLRFHMKQDASGKDVEAIRGHFSAAGVDRVEVLPTAPFSFDEMVDFEREVHQAVRSSGRYSEVVSRIDFINGRIGVTASLNERSTVDQRAAEAYIASETRNVPAPFELVETVEMLGNKETMFGGSHFQAFVNQSNSPPGGGGGGTWGQPGCTTAFSARHPSTGKTGFVIAEHCDGDSTVNSTSQGWSWRSRRAVSGGYKKAVLVSQHSGVWGDFAFFNTPCCPDSHRFWDGHIKRQALSKASAGGYYLNMWVCQYGIITGKDCGGITDTWMSANGLSSLVGANVATEHGDSGGPYWINNEVLGIHHGRYNGNAAFSRIHYAEILLGVEVILG